MEKYILGNSGSSEWKIRPLLLLLSGHELRDSLLEIFLCSIPCMYYSKKVNFGNMFFYTEYRYNIRPSFGD
jgi:hypothetical protein